VVERITLITPGVAMLCSVTTMATALLSVHVIIGNCSAFFFQPAAGKPTLASG